MKRKIACFIMILMLVSVSAFAQTEKRESVYVVTDAAGSAQKVIVSDHLVNGDKLDTIEDTSTLTDIKNVKGYEEFTQSGESLTWAAAGNDIFYQGTSDKALPVNTKITYMLDGVEKTAEEMKGASGRVTIAIDYENTTEPYAPMLAISAMLLDGDSFTNLEVTGGTWVSDGSRYVVTGIAAPGLTENLAIPEDMEIDIPERLEVSADTTDFAFSGAMTACVNANSTEAIGKLDEAFADIKDTSSQLTDAATQLTDGTASLSDGAAQLDSGADELLGGITELCTGLTTITGNNEALTAGAKQVFDTLIATANSQLSAFAEAGLAIPELTIENYAQVLDEFGNEDGIRAVVTDAVNAQRDAVKVQVTDAVKAQVTEKVNTSADEVRAKVTEAVKPQVLEGVLKAAGMEMTADDFDAAVKAGKVDEDTQKSINAAVDAAIEGDDVKAQIDAATQEQIAGLVDSNMASDEIAQTIESETDKQVAALIEQNMESDDVKGKIDDGVKTAMGAITANADALTTLRTTLDSYNEFYTGILQYTEGVSSALDGANQLAEGAQSLKDGTAQLNEGAQSLNDGMAQFNTDAVEKLTGYVDGDIQKLVESLDTIGAGAAEYGIYTSAPDDMTASCVYIYRSGAID